jgi:purine nucleosidase
MTRAIIIDTDPSVDDAVAILMALGSPEDLEVLAITTVAGNVPLALTTRNALKTLELAGRAEVPVFAGAAAPLSGALRTAEHVHGDSGLDGYDLPERSAGPAPGFAPDKIVEMVMARPPGAVTLCAIAPMTNIALALARAPQLATRLREIVIFGGARREGGNITPAAEFNLFVDPEAAHRVLSSGANITLIPLDCSHQALTATPRLNTLRAIGTTVAEALYHLLRFNKGFHERRHGTDGAPLHDPLTVAYLLKPELFSGRRIAVAVERDSPLTRGMSVMDWWGVAGSPPNAQVLTDVDADAYFALLFERIAALG